MELTHSRHLPAERDAVWRALTDPEQLRAVIPGCESIERTGDNEFRVTMVAAVGPVRARFTGRLTLTDVVPPHSYTLTFEGQGGPAGFAKGVARVALTPEPGGTRFDDTVSAQVGGRLAQAGQRLIDAAAGKLEDEFFAALSSSLAAQAGIVSNVGSRTPAPASRKLLWIGAALLALVVALFFALR
jgi:carbon monoxide dehydrogenase subunit G